jgi:hypothetical protein
VSRYPCQALSSMDSVTRMTSGKQSSTSQICSPKLLFLALVCPLVPTNTICHRRRQAIPTHFSMSPYNRRQSYSTRLLFALYPPIQPWDCVKTFQLWVLPVSFFPTPHFPCTYSWEDLGFPALHIPELSAPPCGMSSAVTVIRSTRFLTQTSRKRSQRSRHNCV